MNKKEIEMMIINKWEDSIGLSFEKILKQSRNNRGIAINKCRYELMDSRKIEGDLTLDKLKSDYNSGCIKKLKKDFELLSLTYIGDNMMESILRIIKLNNWTMEGIYDKYKNGFKGNIMSLVVCKNTVYSV